jgi:Fe2+ or Zn2+ uptake regulation protein
MMWRMQHSEINSEDVLGQCKERGLRRTKALEVLVETLLEKDSPMTLAELAEHASLTELCDRATVFRLLQRLTDKGIIRRLGLHERAAYFTLLIPGRHQDFLICTSCGDIKPIKAPCPVHELEKEIANSTGYAHLYHELEFFGTCPPCSKE